VLSLAQLHVLGEGYVEWTANPPTSNVPNVDSFVFAIVSSDSFSASQTLMGHVVNTAAD